MPDSPSGFDYKRYLASREWALLREQVRDRSGNWCEHCFVAPQQAVHHLTYARIGHETLDDLMAVCNPCHEFLSGKRAFNPLGEWGVVTPALADHAHFLLPFQPGMSVRITACTDLGCLWCGYVDEHWPLFLRWLVAP